MPQAALSLDIFTPHGLSLLAILDADRSQYLVHGCFWDWLDNLGGCTTERCMCCSNGAGDLVSRDSSFDRGPDTAHGTQDCRCCDGCKELIPWLTNGQKRKATRDRARLVKTSQLLLRCHAVHQQPDNMLGLR